MNAVVRLRITSFADTRTKELLGRGRAIEQARADQVLLARFNQAVRENVARRKESARG